MQVRLKSDDDTDEQLALGPGAGPGAEPAGPLIETDKAPLGPLIAYRFEPGGEAWQYELWESVFAEIEARLAIEFYDLGREVNLVIDTAESLGENVLGVMRAAMNAPRKVLMSDILDFEPWYRAVAQHELMHALGFGHVADDVDSLMTRTISPLSDGMTDLDWASLDAAYPAPEDFGERRDAARWAEFVETRSRWQAGEATLADVYADAQAHAGGPDAILFLEDYGLGL